MSRTTKSTLIISTTHVPAMLSTATLVALVAFLGNASPAAAQGNPDCTVTSTCTETSLTTPARYTATVYTTTTLTETDPTSTTTFFTTETDTETDTQTSTIVAVTGTTTETETTTTYPTFTQPTPDGFQPVQSSLPGSSYDGAYGGGVGDLAKRALDGVKRRLKRHVPMLPRAASPEAEAEAKAEPQPGPKAEPEPWMFPGDNCEPGCEPECEPPCATTYTTTTTTITVAAPTATTTLTETETTTTTPLASTTSTETDTTTITEVTTQVVPTEATTTTTETETGTFTYTVQAACATNNFADFFLGVPAVGVEPLDGGVQSQILPGVENPEDCCNWALGIEDQNSVTDFWAYTPSSGQCTRYYTPGGPCDNVQADDEAALVISEGEHAPIVAGNGYCGLIFTFDIIN